MRATITVKFIHIGLQPSGESPKHKGPPQQDKNAGGGGGGGNVDAQAQLKYENDRLKLALAQRFV